MTHATPALWSRPTVSWMLYDLANTCFSFAILTFYFPRWITDDLGGNDALLSYAIALSMGLLLLSAPILGALSDQTPRRMPFLVATTLGCVAFTALLGVGGLGAALLLFALANFFFQAGLIFYDALLPEVSSPESRGRVSGFGIGVGYIGSFLVLAVGTALLARGFGRAALFPATALLFALFALPCFLFVKERPRAGQPLTWAAVRAAFAAVRQTIARLQTFPGLGRFLVARIFYADVANTLITFTAIYVQQELGFSEAEVTALGALSIVASILGGFGWGLVLDRLGPKRTLLTILVVWLVSIGVAGAIPLLGLPRLLFFPVALTAGISLGGTWAADRLLMLRLSPPEHLGQFYGLYSMVGRFGQLLGPLLWGFVAVTLGWGRPAALLSLSLLAAAAFLILRPLPSE